MDSEKKRFPRSRRNRRRRRNNNRERQDGPNDFPPLGRTYQQNNNQRSYNWSKQRTNSYQVSVAPRKDILTKAQEGFNIMSSFLRFSDSPPIPPFN